MMNQEQFLKALRDRIAMLEQAEQEDILAEYTQHIEMQMKNGLTEEEAIRDFGPLDELAAEILEAYHINPGYQAEPEAAEKPHRLRQWKEKFLEVWHRFTARVRSCLQQKPGKKKERQPREKKGHITMSAVSRGSRSFLSTVGHGCRCFAGWLAWLCAVALWLCWNGLLLCCAVPLAAVVLLSIVGLGLLLVLLVQGYPLAGVTLMVLGGLLCCGALLGLGRELIWHRTAAAEKEADDENE